MSKELNRLDVIKGLKECQDKLFDILVFFDCSDDYNEYLLHHSQCLSRVSRLLDEFLEI